MSDGGDDHSRQRRKAQPHQDRGDDRHRHTEAAHPLQKGGEHPTDNQRLHAAVGRQMRQGLPNGADGAGLIRHAIQQKGSPDDQQHIHGEQQRPRMRIGEEFRPGAEENYGN